MSTKPLSIFVVCFLLISCFSTQPTTKKRSVQQPTGTIVWQKIGTVPQLDSVPIVPTEFIVAGEAPVLATRQHLVLKGGGEYKKKKEFRVIKFDRGEWKTIRYQKSYAQNWFSNITYHNNKLFLIYNWLTIQHLKNGKWTEFTGGKQFSPAKVKGYQYYPKLQFNSNGIPVAMWNDGSYIKEGYTKGGKWISASQYINGKWAWVGRRAFAKDAGKPLFCLSNDQPWTMFLDFGEEVYKDGRVILSMMTLENGKWIYKGKRGFNPGSCSSSGFDFDVHNGIPYTIFTYEDKWTGHYSTRTKRAVVMKFENNTWTTIGNLNSTGEIRNPQIQITDRGEIFVAYIDNFKQICVRKFNGENWSDLGQIARVPFGGHLKHGQWIKAYQFHKLHFDISASGIPYVAFIQKAYVRTRGVAGDRTYDELFVYKYEGKK